MKQRSGAGMVVEMLGAPGSGKTTVLPAVLAACEDAGLRPLSPHDAARDVAQRTTAGAFAARVAPPAWRDRALWGAHRLVGAARTVRFALTHRELTRFVVRSQWRRPPEADARRRRVLYWYLRTMGTFGSFTANAGPDEVVVFDEGLLHRAVQLLSSSVEVATEQQIADYAGLLPPPHIVVHVTASVETCQRRVRDRGVWRRLRHRTGREIDSYIVNAHDTTSLMRAELGRRGWTVIDVVNERRSPDEVADDLRHRLAGALSGLRTHRVTPTR